MSRRKQPEIKITHILILYLASFLLHCILHILIKESPTVVIDEGLYANLARSLAWDGEIAFRGQPVDFPYILYPLLLVPLYRLNHLLGGDIYRYIQVFNTLLITSSVIPVYLFALDFTNDKQKAFYSAVLSAIMPDMLMGGYLMTESLLWPLAIWLLFFSYRWYKNAHIKYGLLTALFTALMFFTKPGAVTFGTVLLLVQFVLSVRKGKKDITNAALSILLLIVLIASVYVLYIYGFDQQKTILGLYEKQTSEWKPKDILVAIEASFLMTFLFIFACGGIFVLIPLLFLKEYKPIEQHFITASLLGVFAVILGTAVFVVPFKWDSSLGKLPLHLRYSSMFIPAFFIFAAGIDLTAKQMKNRKTILIALAVFSVLALFPGARSGFIPGKTGTIDSITLSAFHTTNRLNGSATGWIATLIIIGLSVYLFLNLKTGWDRSVRKNTVCFFVGFVLFNTLCAHINAAVPIDRTIAQDANEVKQLIKDRESLGITQRHYDDIYSYWLDSRLNKPMQQITIDQMFAEMQQSAGVYTPFVPVEQSPNINNHSTPDTDTFVLGMTIAEHLELSDNVSSETTAGGHFTVVRIEPGERWVDSMMYGLDDDRLYEGQTAVIHIFDIDRYENDNLILSLTASGNSTLIIDDKTIRLDAEVKTYDIPLKPAVLINIKAQDGTAEIHRYAIDHDQNRLTVK